MTNNRPNRSLPVILGALLCVAALLAAACSSGGGSDQTGASQGTSLHGGEPNTGPQSPVTIAATGTPKAGGDLIYAIEADSDGFNPALKPWSIVGTMMGLTVYDPLVALDKDAKPQPYLAASFKSSNENKTWTFTLRPDVKFHNGQTLTAADVKTTYDKHLASPLTKTVFGPLDSVDAPDPLTVVFNMKTPWASFPAILTGQAGVVPSPVVYESDEASRKPVGTGPFKLVGWTQNKSFKATKFADYWRKGLPYLDSVEFRPTPDNRSRLNVLKTGEVTMLHTTDGDYIRQIRAMAAEGKIQDVEDMGEAEEGFVMLNCSKPPFDLKAARQAMAYATDVATYIQTFGGVNARADSVFTKNSPWYTDSSYPDYDLEKAKALVAQVKQQTGSFKFTLGGGGPDTRQNLEALQQMYQAAGMDVTVEPVDQAQFINLAVTGQYQANLWRQFGAPDPDADYLWWISDNADGPIALNIARHKDAEIDAALKKGRASADPAVRKEAYATVQKRMAESVPYVFLDHTVWAIAAQNNVRGITNGPLPDGKPAYPLGGAGFPGVHFLTQTWLAS